ncbi:MAG: hypothetical protein KDA85_06720 [Planctomycetaceae bacterium]|nr:hypothetical protein [Planctomycetaceae bacterium]
MTEATESPPDDQNPYSPPADQDAEPEVSISVMQWISILLAAVPSAIGAFLVTCIGSGCLLFHPQPPLDPDWSNGQILLNLVLPILPFILGGLVGVFVARRAIRRQIHEIHIAIARPQKRHHPRIR